MFTNTIRFERRLDYTMFKNVIFSTLIRKAYFFKLKLFISLSEKCIFLNLNYSCLCKIVLFLKIYKPKLMELNYK